MAELGMSAPNLPRSTADADSTNVAYAQVIHER